MSKKFEVKDRSPAPIQITAEQILRSAQERVFQEPKPPVQQITDKEELLQLKMRKRKEFEDSIRRQRQHLGTYIKYAKWEESQKEFERARSIFERAIDVDYRSPSLWLKYTEMEMRNKFLNHARNIWDRVCPLLPRIDQFWLKYAYMEEMLGNIEATRNVFERWMEWEPDDNGWSAYIKFEMRQNEITRSRNIFERYIRCHTTERAYLKYAKWEEKTQFQKSNSRNIFERAFVELPEEQMTQKLFIAFANFEERCREYDRARAIYKYALSKMKREDIPELYQEFINFEKKYGTKEEIEEVIVNKRRKQYEEQIGQNPHNYDTLFDYIRLEEAEGEISRIREVYERAIAILPLIEEKAYWRRYIYLWINYALFEELQSKDVHRTREIYRTCLNVIPHQRFSFAKIWLMFAHFELRQKDLSAARKILGQAIGMCGKEKIYKGYIHLETQLGEIERCRTLYAKYLAAMPSNCAAWSSFAEMEKVVGETDRARAIFELAISQPILDMPETLWKSYIDFEIEEGEVENVRTLYERLLERTSHVKVWISYAKFEALNEDGMENSRAIFRRAYDTLKKQNLKEERVILLEAWREIEKEAGPAGDMEEVESKMPKKIKKKRMVFGDDNEELGMEEYYDYQFPDDKVAISGLKILERAYQWQQQKKRARDDDDDDDDNNNNHVADNNDNDNNNHDVDNNDNQFATN